MFAKRKSNLSAKPKERGKTLDFSLQCREDGKIYIAEMKCELAFDNHKYLRLTDPIQLDHHNKPAFNLFLRAASNPKAISARINGKNQEFEGCILVWGAVTDEGRNAVKQKYGFHDILSLEQILLDLRNWRDQNWLNCVSSRRDWASSLFDSLASYR